jgi:putative intracellular protease/amidase
MRKVSIFVAVMLFFIAGVVSFTAEVYGQSGKKVLMIPREGYSSDLDLMIKMEVGVMRYHLRSAGFEVDIATTSGFPILGSTQKIEKVMRLADINLDNYAGIIMPCMAVGAFPGPPVSQEAIVLVKKALSEGKPVAASTFSVIILAEAGVLKGKKYASGRDPLKPAPAAAQAAAPAAARLTGAIIPDWPIMAATDPRFAGAIYSGAGVVQDGKIITSGACPFMQEAWGAEDKTLELTKTFIKAIGVK